MQEQLISFETAKLAKEKGFDVKCTDWYNLEDRMFNQKELLEGKLMNRTNYGEHGRINYNVGTYEVSAPTQSLLQKWLRKKHHKNVFPKKVDIRFGWHWLIEDMNGLHLKGEMIKNLGKEEYEDALEIGLQEALKLIK